MKLRTVLIAAILIGVFMILVRVGIAVAGIILLAVTVSAQTAGEPSLEEFRAVYEPAIKEELKDPDSAKFDWPYHFSRESNGFLTCGYLNAKNSYGGYSGKTPVVAVYSYGAKPYFNILDDTAECPEYIVKKLKLRSK